MAVVIVLQSTPYAGLDMTSCHSEIAGFITEEQYKMQTIQTQYNL